MLDPDLAIVDAKMDHRRKDALDSLPSQIQELIVLMDVITNLAHLNAGQSRAIPRFLLDKLDRDRLVAYYFLHSTILSAAMSTQRLSGWAQQRRVDWSEGLYEPT